MPTDHRVANQWANDEDNVDVASNRKLPPVCCCAGVIWYIAKLWYFRQMHGIVYLFTCIHFVNSFAIETNGSERVCERVKKRKREGERERTGEGKRVREMQMHMHVHTAFWFRKFTIFLSLQLGTCHFCECNTVLATMPKHSASAVKLFCAQQTVLHITAASTPLSTNNSNRQ